MSFIAVAIGGGALASLGGSLISSSSAGNAAQTQAQATAQAAQLQAQSEKDALAQQQGQFNTLQSNEQPWMQAGIGALSKMQDPS